MEKEIADAIDAHLEWACEKNNGNVNADELAKTIIQIIKPATDYAKELAVAIWEEFYRTDSPEWEPLDDLLGILTQIDNMVLGLTRKKP